VERPDHPIGVRLQLAAVGPDQGLEGPLVTALGGGEQPVLLIFGLSAHSSTTEIRAARQIHRSITD
jgi:hypothetical protein